MRVLNVHSRELPSPAERAWELVAGLASEHDELWPSERWPTSPIEFDRRLGPGAKGGHGAVRYDVERYEPGRRVVFRFARSSGLDGIHALEVQPIGAQRSRLIPHPRHARAVEAGAAVSPAAGGSRRADRRPARQGERAAGGCPGEPQPLPRRLRIANAVEAGLIRLRRNALGWLVPGTLAAIAALLLPAAAVSHAAAAVKPRISSAVSS